MTNVPIHTTEPWRRRRCWRRSISVTLVPTILLFCGTMGRHVDALTGNSLARRRGCRHLPCDAIHRDSGTSNFHGSRILLPPLEGTECGTDQCHVMDSMTFRGVQQQDDTTDLSGAATSDVFSPTARAVAGVATAVMATMVTPSLAVAIASPAAITSIPVRENTFVMAATAATDVPTIMMAFASLTIPSSLPAPIETALTAYIHYLSMFVIVASILTERATVRPNMTIEEEWRMGLADIVLGVSAVGVVLSGYHRLFVEKGITFYIHQPFFWIKMCIVGYDLGLSLFVTVLVVQRTVQLQLNDGTIKTGPMSKRMADRIRQITGQHLFALVVMPLAATLMARGVGSASVDYSSMQVPMVGALIVGSITAYACIKYAGEALQWDYDDTGSSIIATDNYR